MNVNELEKFVPVGSFYDVKAQLQRHVYDRSLACFAQGDASRDAIGTWEQVQKRQRAVRKFIVKAVGGLPSNRTPLRPQITGSVKGKGFEIEKIIFESRPKTFVTCNLYLPDDMQGPRGAVLLLCGHAEPAKTYEEYQRVCQTLAQAGLVVLALDPIGQGERVSYPDDPAVTWGCCEHDYAGAQCQPLGDSLARYFLHDAMRGVDYLCSRAEVDSTRIGVTGNSGGGTQTSLMMLADPRVAAAAPGTFIMSRETYMWTGQAQDAEQIWPGFTAAGFDHEDILLAMCPKPVRVLAVTSDFFPIEGTRRTVQRCQRFWKMGKTPKNIDLVEDASIHSYTPRLAEAAADFFSKHLLGKTRIKPSDVKLFPQKKLWCTESGQVRGEIRGARGVNEENVARLKEITQRPTATKSQTKAWLKRRVMAHRQPCPLNLRIAWNKTVNKLQVSAGFWFSQPNLCNEGLLFRSLKHADKTSPVTLAIWDQGCMSLKTHWTWIQKQCQSGRAVLVVDVSGSGHLEPNPFNAASPRQFYGVLHKLQDDLTWMDDDLAALRAYDVLRAIDVIGQWSNLTTEGLHLYAHGREGLYAQLAAPLDSRIKKIQVVGGLGSYAKITKARRYDSSHSPKCWRISL
ncbi:prolyl oligopeptidase family serine peptidase [bacterium AH-315-I18]|nr:prolyl oligopeptidase family serine peptidase [bacterium AH-315-I18]